MKPPAAPIASHITKNTTVKTTLRRLLLAISLYTRRIVREGRYPGPRTSAAASGANFDRYPVALVRPGHERPRPSIPNSRDRKPSDPQPNDQQPAPEGDRASMSIRPIHH